MDVKKWLGVSLVLLPLISCGGGGDSDSGGTPPPANVAPTVDISDIQAINESETIQIEASASDSDGSISTYLWQQIGGPIFEIHQADTATLVATAPLIESATTAKFKLTVTDNSGTSSSDDLMVDILLATPELIDVTINAVIPTTVTSIQTTDITFTSFASPTEQVFKQASPTLLIAKDNDGSTLLGFANENGGLLGETQGEVNLSVDSTAIILISVAGGYPISSISNNIISTIQSNSEYSNLIEQLVVLMDIDKNYLDRIFEYSETVALIKQIATVLPAPPENLQSSAQVFFLKHSSRKSFKNRSSTLNAKSSSLSVNSFSNSPSIQSTVKDNFYCSALWWPCSDWKDNEPWIWFGQAKGVEEFYPNSSLAFFQKMAKAMWAPAAVYSFAQGYGSMFSEARHVPFLANSEKNKKIHAIANPGFVNYAMEAYNNDEFQGWYYTPRNSTMIQKLLNSGAAYREFSTGTDTLINPSIDHLKFKRYRLGWNGDETGIEGNRVALVSTMNALGVLFSALNVISDMSEISDFLDKLSLTSSERINNFVGCAITIGASVDVYYDNNVQSDLDKYWSFVTNNVQTLVETLIESDDCQSVALSSGKKLSTILAKQLVKAQIDTALLATPLGWAKLAFDVSNDTAPVATSYFSTKNAGVEYFLEWDNNGSTPFISNVSSNILPSASFSFTQQNGTYLSIDGTNSTVDESSYLTYQWFVDDVQINESESIISYNFSYTGTYKVKLTVTDGFGNQDSFVSLVNVLSGHKPSITSLSCFATDSFNTAQLAVDFSDEDDDVSEIRWFDNPRSDEPIQILTANEKTTTLVFDTTHPYAFSKVEVVDSQGNTDTKICNIRMNYIADRYVVHGDGTVTDTTTDLQWMRCSLGQTATSNACEGDVVKYSWHDAFYKAKTNYSGYSGWRLPTSGELKTLIYCSSGSPGYWNTSNKVCQGNYTSPTIYQGAFPNTPDFLTWTSKPYRHETILASSWAVNFSFHETASYYTWYWLRNNEHNIRLVRDIQPLEKYSLRSFTLGQGDIYGLDGQISCHGECNNNMSSHVQVTLTARPSSNQAFLGWEGDCVGSNPTCKVHMDRARQVIAKFSDNTPPETYLLRVNTTGYGESSVTSSPSGINCAYLNGGDCEQEFNSGTNVTLTANAASGYAFAGWSGACSGHSLTCSLTMNYAKNVTATFTEHVELKGDPEFQLTWEHDQSNEGPDIDIWIEDPLGHLLSASRDGYGLGSEPEGGRIDVDDEGQTGDGDGNGPERAYWPEGDAPQGTYKYGVRYFTGTGAANITLRVYHNGSLVEVKTKTLSAQGSKIQLGSFTN